MTETILGRDHPAMKIQIVTESHGKCDTIPDYEHENHCVEHEEKTARG
jgi:hypothetical protein